MKLLIYLLIPLLFSISLLSQNQIQKKPSEKIIFEHITEDNGLSNNNITSILQDNKGYIWIGTKNGLNKYNGYKFIIYKHDSNNPLSLEQNYISAIYEDLQGTLWIGSQGKNLKGFPKGNLSKFNREKNQFKHFTVDGQIASITEDSFGNILVGTKSGINIFDIKTEKATLYTIDKIDKKNVMNRVNSLCRTDYSKQNLLWIGTERGLYKTDEKLTNYTAFMPDKNYIFSISDRSILSLCEDKIGNLWIGTEIGGLNKYDVNSKNFYYFKHDDSHVNSLSHNKVQTIFIDSLGIIWIGTKKGLNKFDISKKLFIRYTHDLSNPYSITSDDISTIFEDNSGMIWVGTNGGGINKINKQINQFTHYSNNPFDSSSLINNIVRSVYQDTRGTIWIGTHKGLEKFDIINDRFIHYSKKNNYPTGIRSNIIWDIIEDNMGNLWIGLFDGGLIRLNPNTAKFKHFKTRKGNTNCLSQNNIRTIFKDSKGFFWIGTFSGGLNKLDPKNERFIQYRNDPSNPESISSDRITSISEVEDELWIGTQRGGINKFNRQTEKFKVYKYSKKNPNSLSNDNIWSIYQDRKGELWVATNGGLNRFNKNIDNFIRYKFDQDSIANDIVKILYEDQYDQLWVGSNSGLFKYIRKNGKFIHYGEKYGIPEFTVDAILEDDKGNLWVYEDKYLIKINPQTEKKNLYKLNISLEINDGFKNSYLKCKDGKFIISGINGFIYFDPNKIKDNNVIPQIVLTDFKIFNKSVAIKKNNNSENDDFILLDKHISETNIIKIPYDKNVFSIEFSSLDFRNPQKNKFAYKLQGVDPDWVYTDATRRFATYNQLNPGKYTFFVKGTNNDGIWNNEGKSLKIIITPLWWQTIWFRTFVFVLIIGIILYVFYNRINALKKKQQIQEEFSRKLIDSQETERKRIATALHDSHGQNLLVISNEVQYFVNEHQKYKKELSPVSKIVQESIDEIRNISYDLHPHQLEKLGLVKTIKSMTKKIENSSDIKFNLNIDNVDDLFDKNVEINLYRIIQEAINNIIKHSKATESEIEIKKNIKYINISISDNGVGFDKIKMLKEVKGLGINGMKERVNLINGDFKLISEKENGTKIDIRIPYKA